MSNEIIVLGVILSLLFTEATGFSAGIVVPGYLALCLQTPQRIVYTLFIVLLILGASKLIGTVTILYGKRRFAMMILLGLILNFAVESSGILAQPPGLIGCIVPAIMANEMERQGIVVTLLSTAVLVAILACVMMWKGLMVFAI